MSIYFIETIQNQRIDGVGELTENTTIIWRVLHGYRQLVEYFKTYFHSLLARAGSWPPDLEDESQKMLAQMSTSSCFGTYSFIGKDKRTERIASYNNKFDLNPEVNTYDREHTSCSDILANEINRLENITLKR